jgi:hypothetical protein
VDKFVKTYGEALWHAVCFSVEKPNNKEKQQMNKVIAGLFAAALLGGVNVYADVAASAPAAKDLKNIVEEGPYVETSQKGIKLSGYIDAGYSYNFNGIGGVAARVLNSADNGGHGDFNLNAVKLTLAKDLTDANELQGGFRVDLKLGEDVNGFTDTSDDGLGNSNELLVQQAYVILRAPVGNGIDIKVGKFASLLGYEGDDRPANLNISYGYDYFFVTTLQTGVVGAYKFNDVVDVQFGVTNGSGVDNNIGTSFTFAGLTAVDSNDGVALTGSINVTAPGGNANIYNAFYYEVAGGAINKLENEPVFVWNTWGNWVPKFANDKLLLGFSQTLGVADDAASPRIPLIPSTAADEGNTWWTGSLYAKYQFTDIFSLAGRASYFHTHNQNLAATAVGVNNADFWSWTLTGGFDLAENLLLRAEYRVDFGGDLISTSGDVGHLISTQVVYSF